MRQTNNGSSSKDVNNHNSNSTNKKTGNKSSKHGFCYYCTLCFIPTFFVVLLFLRHPTSVDSLGTALLRSAALNSSYSYGYSYSSMDRLTSTMNSTNIYELFQTLSTYQLPQLLPTITPKRTVSNSYITWCMPKTCKALQHQYKTTKHNITTLNALYNLETNSLYSLHQCINSTEIPMRINVTQDAALFFNQTLQALASRRQLCDFEHRLLWNEFHLEMIGERFFRPKAGFPIYQAYDLLTMAIWSQTLLPARKDGLWLEFGVSKARSTNITSMVFAHRNLTNHIEIHGFDSFEGLPTAWKKGNSTFVKGDFHVEGKIPPVREDIIIHQGLFEDQVPPFLRNLIALSKEKKDLEIVGMNIDNDLYEGALYLLRQLKPFLRPKTLVHFHELFSLLSADNPMDELRALYEFLMETDVGLELLPVRASFPEPAVFSIAEVL